MITFLANYPILLFICVMIVLLAVWFPTAVILNKIMNSSAEKKYQREFGLMCNAVASVICSKTKCNLRELTYKIDDNLAYCTKYKDLKCDERIRSYYYDKDYMSFTYLAAQMCFEYTKDSEDYEALLQFCGYNKSTSAFVRNESSGGNKLSLYPEGSGYLYSLPLLVAIGIVVYLIIGIYKILTTVL